MTDGQGYHAYLPAIILYQDLQFSFVDSLNEKYYPADKRAAFIVRGSSGNVNKYYAGTALMQAPFFIGGCVISWMTETPIDGYSWPFQLMVGVAAIFYLVLGLWFLIAALTEMGFSRIAAITSGLIMFFGTNLLYYTLYEPSMSHVYSFCTVSAFLYFGQAAILRSKVSSWIHTALALGITVLIRPTNGLIVLAIPAIAGGSFNALNAIESLLRKKRVIFLSILVCAAIVSCQILIYLVQTGAPLVWSYGKEGFNFTSPEILNVLFSYRKGLFVYSPVLLLSVLGMMVGWSKGRKGFAELMAFLVLVTWVISSWWMWYYGGSFGQRSFIDYLPFFAIGLAFILKNGWGIFRPTIFYILGILLVGVQLIQTYQYRNNILPFDNISKTKYWNLFLRTGDDLAWYYSGYEGQDSYVAIDSVLVSNDMETPLGWGNEHQLTAEESKGGDNSARMTSTDQYGLTYRKPVSELALQPDLVRISCWVKADSSRITDLAFVCSIEDSTGAAYYWRKYPLRPQLKGKNVWSWTTGLYKCGLPRDSTDKFVIYPLKSDNATVCLDDLEISFVRTK